MLEKKTRKSKRNSSRRKVIKMRAEKSIKLKTKIKRTKPMKQKAGPLKRSVKLI